ncbi:Inosine-5'-monophosphate dehydrogenase [Candidatus Methanoperedenaceae archaeon GB50]|nr:Inosine-5'-monophosphate dehydrogenase [Candidatus Methanoperedenaceae archaeon GB50]
MIDILVEEIMTRDVVYTTIPGSRDKVLNLLKEKQVSAVPVVKDGSLVGIVTRSDFLENPEEEQTALLMTRDPITAEPYESIESAARQLIQHGIRRLPVVENGELVGIITVSDIIGTIANLGIEEPIGEYVDPFVVSVWEETPLPLVGRIMELAGVKVVPVLDSACNFVGVISDKDLIQSSTIVDTVERSDMSAGSDEDVWTWESIRDTMSLYYSVSRVELPDIPAKEIMKNNDLTVLHTTPVSECARMMHRRGQRHLPLVKSNQQLKGLVEDTDLLKAIV